MSGFKGIVSAVAKDLASRLPNQRATQRRKLSELVGGILVCQTPNLMELSNVLDRPTQSADSPASIRSCLDDRPKSRKQRVRGLDGFSTFAQAGRSFILDS